MKEECKKEKRERETERERERGGGGRTATRERERKRERESKQTEITEVLRRCSNVAGVDPHEWIQTMTFSFARLLIHMNGFKQ